MSWVETARLTVEKIKKKREETLVVQEAEKLVRDIDCERSELSEKRTIHINKAAELFNKRGWIQIFSGYLNSNLFLVRNKKIRVPDPSLPKYTEKEAMKLHGLTLDELKTLHDAKVIFNGEIL